jgi:hypothetical protein
MYVLLYCGVCTGVRLLPPGENPIAVRNNNNNNNNMSMKLLMLVFPEGRRVQTRNHTTRMHYLKVYIPHYFMLICLILPPPLPPLSNSK